MAFEINFNHRSTYRIIIRWVIRPTICWTLTNKPTIYPHRNCFKNWGVVQFDFIICAWGRYGGVINHKLSVLCKSQFNITKISFHSPRSVCQFIVPTTYFYRGCGESYCYQGILTPLGKSKTPVHLRTLKFLGLN